MYKTNEETRMNIPSKLHEDSTLQPEHQLYNVKVNTFPDEVKLASFYSFLRTLNYWFSWRNILRGYSFLPCIGGESLFDSTCNVQEEVEEKREEVEKKLQAKEEIF